MATTTTHLAPVALSRDGSPLWLSAPPTFPSDKHHKALRELHEADEGLD